MKKQVKKLVLAKETLRDLTSNPKLQEIKGGLLDTVGGAVCHNTQTTSQDQETRDC